MKGFCDYEIKKNGKYLKLLNFTLLDSSSSDKEIEAEMNDE